MAEPQRLAPADLMANLADDALRLATRMASPARTHREVEDRMHEADRIGAAIVRVGRRAPARTA